MQRFGVAWRFPGLAKGYALNAARPVAYGWPAASSRHQRQLYLLDKSALSLHGAAYTQEAGVINNDSNENLPMERFYRRWGNYKPGKVDRAIQAAIKAGVITTCTCMIVQVVTPQGHPRIALLATAFTLLGATTMGVGSITSSIRLKRRLRQMKHDRDEAVEAETARLHRQMFTSGPGPHP
jgi:hypothetical protein